MRDREPLFSRNDMHATMENHKHHAREKVDRINSAQFLNSTDDQLVDHICAELHVEPLQVFEDRAQMHEEERKVDVTGDFRYGGWPGERTFVPGLMVKITIPYTGDEGLWHIRPSSWWSSFPYSDVNPVDHQGVGSISISMTRPVDADPQEFKRHYDEQLKLIKDYIANQTRDVQNHLQQLGTQTLPRSFAGRRRAIGQRVLTVAGWREGNTVTGAHARRCCTEGTIETPALLSHMIPATV